MPAHPRWRKLTYNQWSYGGVDAQPLRHIVYNPFQGTEPHGDKYVVTGGGHGATVHPTLRAAKTAAEASLRT